MQHIFGNEMTKLVIIKHFKHDLQKSCVYCKAYAL